MSFLPCNYGIIVFEIILWYCAKCLILLVFNNKLLMQAQINFFTTMAVQTVKLSIHALLIPIYYPIIFSPVIFFVIHDFRLTFCLETKSTYSYFKKHMGLLCIIYLMTLGKLMRSKSNGEENMFPSFPFLFIFKMINVVIHTCRYVEVNMDSAALVWPLFNSLQAFWPGLQVFGFL